MHLDQCLGHSNWSDSTRISMQGKKAIKLIAYQFNARNETLHEVQQFPLSDGLQCGHNSDTHVSYSAIQPDLLKVFQEILNHESRVDLRNQVLKPYVAKKIEARMGMRVGMASPP